MEKEQKQEFFFEGEEAAVFEELAEQENQLNNSFRLAKTRWKMLDLKHSRMMIKDWILIFLWIGAWVVWKIEFWDLGKYPGVGHRWGRLGGTLFVLWWALPMTYKGILAVKELLENSGIAYFKNRAKDLGLSSLSLDKEESEAEMFAISDKLGVVQFQMQKMLQERKDELSPKEEL